MPVIVNVAAATLDIPAAVVIIDTIGLIVPATAVNTAPTIVNSTISTITAPPTPHVAAPLIAILGSIVANGDVAISWLRVVGNSTPIVPQPVPQAAQWVHCGFFLRPALLSCTPIIVRRHLLGARPTNVTSDTMGNGGGRGGGSASVLVLLDVAPPVVTFDAVVDVAVERPGRSMVMPIGLAAAELFEDERRPHPERAVAVGAGGEYAAFFGHSDMHYESAAADAEARTVMNAAYPLSTAGSGLAVPPRRRSTSMPDPTSRETDWDGSADSAFRVMADDCTYNPAAGTAPATCFIPILPQNRLALVAYTTLAIPISHAPFGGRNALNVDTTIVAGALDPLTPSGTLFTSMHSGFAPRKAMNSETANFPPNPIMLNVFNTWTETVR